jgi:hypothetical protein
MWALMQAHYRSVDEAWASRLHPGRLPRRPASAREAVGGYQSARGRPRAEIFKHRWFPAGWSPAGWNPTPQRPPPRPRQPIVGQLAALALLMQLYEKEALPDTT